MRTDSKTFFSRIEENLRQNVHPGSDFSDVHIEDKLCVMVTIEVLAQDLAHVNKSSCPSGGKPALEQIFWEHIFWEQIFPGSDPEDLLF